MEEIIELIKKGYNPSWCNDYRKYYQRVFNQTPSSCNCNCGSIYHRLRNHFIDNAGNVQNYENK